MKSFNANAASHSGLESARKQYYTYLKFAVACKTRLRRFCQEHPSKTSMIYAVPLVLPGAALFDPKQAINHVIHVLKIDGFGAEYIGDNLIFIYWEIQDLPKYKVHDYVASSMMKSKVPMKMIAPNGNIRGPGDAYQVNRDRINHTNHMDKEISKRMSLYADDDSQKLIRRVYNNSTTHQKVLNKVARFHSVL